MRLVTLLCLAALACLSPQTCYAIEAKTLYQQSRTGTVTIFNIDRRGNINSFGTGFYVGSGDMIVTNFHVIEDAHEIGLRDIYGEFNRNLVVYDVNEGWDLALLIPNRPGHPLPLAAYEPQVGEEIITIGNPLGLEGTLSTGIISSVRLHEDDGSFLQMTVPISPGSSGGPVIDGDGVVVGIATLYLTKGQNLNFAVSTTALEKMLPKTAFFMKGSVELQQTKHASLTRSIAPQPVSSPIPEQNEMITTSSFTIVDNNYVGALLVISGEFHNRSGGTMRDVELSALLYDKHNNLIVSHDFPLAPPLTTYQLEELRYTSIHTRLASMDTNIYNDQKVPFMAVIKLPEGNIHHVKINHLN